MIEKAGMGGVVWYLVKPWLWRKHWLILQYSNYKPTSYEYNPQPYNQLASVYREQGQFEDARRITSLKLSTERKVKTYFLWRPFLWIYWLLFDYGLSPKRSIVTLLTLILLGYIGVDFINKNGLLVVDSMPTATVAVSQKENNDDKLHYGFASPISSKTSSQTLIPCGETISPLLYAVDVVIPLLDLRQEFRCHIRPFDPAVDIVDIIKMSPENSHVNLLDLQITDVKKWISNIFKDPRVWLFIKGLYTLLGWVVTSLTILTISGILRRHAEN